MTQVNVGVYAPGMRDAKSIIVLGNALSALMMLEKNLADGKLPDGVAPEELGELSEFFEGVRLQWASEYESLILEGANGEVN